MASHGGSRRESAVIVALVLAFLIGRPPLAAQQADTSRERSPYEQLQLFSSALNHIRVNYMDSVTYGELVRAAINGMLHALDPHSFLLARRDWERRNALERGELSGVGAAVEQEDSAVTVLNVIPGSPAAKAGIQPGDRIAAIDDTVATQLKATDVALRLAGPEGSKVRVRLERGMRLEPDTLSVVLTRRVVNRPIVAASLLPNHVTGYVRLSWFGPKATDELQDAVRGLQRRGAQQLILDLRDNPGGLMEAAVDIASAFFPKGTVIFRTKGRKAEATKDFVTTRDGPFRGLPLIVLLNERSASAAEALAGSLQDHDRALIVGRRSFGKALVQGPFILMPAGDVVMLTIARVITPSGRVIQRRYRHLAVEQYESFAGKSGAAEDTLAVFKTDHGREVRGGGGIAPDIFVPAPRDLPVWWSVAADSGFDFAVADSVAATLPPTPAARDQWLNEPARWSEPLLEPFLARVRTRLHVSALTDSALDARIASSLASRVTMVRWPADGVNELRIRYDPDIRAALTFFAQLASLLSAPQR